MKKTDIQAIADAVIGAPSDIKISIDNPGLWDRILIRAGLKKGFLVFEIKRPTLGLAHKITSLRQELKDLKTPEKDTQKDWANEMRAENTFKLAEIVATYIHGKWREKTPQSLIDYVLDNVDDDDLNSINQIIDSQINIIPFISSIASMRNLDVVTRSLEASLQDTGETIAPGESSETL